MDEPVTHPGPSRTVMVLFGTGSLGTGIYLTVPSVLLLYYLTDVLGISAALAGLAVFLPRAYDILLDPVMGWISDRTRTRMGRRRPYLLAGAVLVGATFVFLFNAPAAATERALFWYVVVVYGLSATAYTVFAVPYLAMPSEMSADPHQRTTVMAYRMGFAMAGILTGASLAPWLIDAFGGGRPGFAAMSWVMGLLAAGTMLLAFFGTRRAPVVIANMSSQPIGTAFRQLAGNRAFRRLGLAYATQLAGLGCFNAAVPYFVIHVMRRGEADMAAILACLLGGSILSMPAWTAISRHIGKQRAYAFAVAMVTAGTGGLWLAVEPSDWTIAVVTSVLMGIGFGGAQLLPFSLLSDVIHESGGEAAGAYTGAWTAIEKAGLAIGPLIVGGALSATGFIEGLSPEGQPAAALEGIRAVLAVAPAVLVAVSLPLLGWRRTGQRKGGSRSSQ